MLKSILLRSYSVEKCRYFKCDTRCQSLRFEKILVWAHSNPDLLSSKVFECACKRFFIKPQTLTSWTLSAPWDTRMLITSFQIPIFFLKHKILKEWFATLLRWFMQCQNTLILLHNMAFQPFWLDLTVYFKKPNLILSFSASSVCASMKTWLQTYAYLLD